MRVGFAHLCDYASISKEGKPSVCGIFNQLLAKSMPCVLKHSMVLTCVVIEPADLGAHVEFKMEMVDPESHALFTMDFDLDIAPTHKPGSLYFVGRLDEIVFPEPGPHEFRISIPKDGSWVPKWTTEFVVEQVG